MDTEYTQYNSYQFVKESEFGFMEEERWEKLQADKEALAQFVKANPQMDELTVKLAEFIVALKGSV